MDLPSEAFQICPLVCFAGGFTSWDNLLQQELSKGKKCLLFFCYVGDVTICKGKKENEKHQKGKHAQADEFSKIFILK